MSGFDGIKGHKGFAENSSDTSKRFEPLLKAERSPTQRFAGRFVAGGVLAIGAASCASAGGAPYIADGNPQQGGGVVYEPVIQDGTPMPFTPEPPFIADGSPQQVGGGTIYEPVAPVEPPFIADGNPLQGGGVVYEPVIQDGTPMPFTPEPPFIADGNPLQGGGTIYEPVAPVEPPFIADGNPIRGGETNIRPLLKGGSSQTADTGRTSFWKMFRRS